MIKYVKITNPLSEELVLNVGDPGNSGFFIKDIQGLDPVKAIINNTETLGFDGVTFNSARSEGRSIFLVLQIDDRAGDVETLRQKAYRFFPLKQRIRVDIVTDNRESYVEARVESINAKIFSPKQHVVAVLNAENAYLKSPDKLITIFSGTENLFEFPFSNESLTDPLINFGEIKLASEGNLMYSGDAVTGVLVTAHMIGNVSGLSMFNVTRNQSMVIDSTKIALLTGSDFITGDDLEVNTIRGQKSITLIRDGTRYNVLTALDTDSLWFTIEPGDNIFTYVAQSGQTNVQFRVEHQDLYMGV